MKRSANDSFVDATALFLKLLLLNQVEIEMPQHYSAHYLSKQVWQALRF